jgi:hypothetical protein
MRLAKTLNNPMSAILELFSKEWKHLSSATFKEFKGALLSCGYVVDTDKEAYAVMGILEDMGLICIIYAQGNPEKIIKL